MSVQPKCKCGRMAIVKTDTVWRCWQCFDDYIAKRVNSTFEGWKQQGYANRPLQPEPTEKTAPPSPALALPPKPKPKKHKPKEQGNLF